MPNPASPTLLHEDALERLLYGIWAFRFELLIAMTPAGIGLLASKLGSPIEPAVAGAYGGWLLLLVAPPVRGLLGRALLRARWRRRLRGAIDVLALSGFRGGRPRLDRIRSTPGGVDLSLVLPPGGSVDDLTSNAERLAALLVARDVQVRRDRDNAQRVHLQVFQRDPFAGDMPAWPLHTPERSSLWSPIPVGVDDDGQQVHISLPEHNLLLGGEPGAGKSAALSLLVAAAAKDPDAQLWLFDPKLVELAPWTPLAVESVGPDLAPAVAALRQLHRVLEDRFATLLASGARKVRPGDGHTLHVVVIDELAAYLTSSDRQLRGEFTDLLRDLVSRGRAAGIIVLAATQKPGSDIIPTSLRDLFGYRWAMRCTTPQASDTILGAGWAGLGMNAAGIDPDRRGVGYLLAEGGTPTRCRSYYLTDGQLPPLATAAHAMRTGLHPQRPATLGSQR